jgi:multidrug resistance efflux pump
MTNDSGKRTSTLTVTFAIAVLIVLLFGIWWLYQQRSASTTGGILNQPMPTGVPDILRKHEPPPTQP